MFDQETVVSCFRSSFQCHGVMEIIWTWFELLLHKKTCWLQMKGKRQTLACHCDLFAFRNLWWCSAYGWLKDLKSSIKQFLQFTAWVYAMGQEKEQEGPRHKTSSYSCSSIKLFLYFAWLLLYSYVTGTFK